jgi:hypothetical protein
MRRHCRKRWWRHGQGDLSGPPSTVLSGRSWAAGLTCDSLEPVVTAHARCTPLPAGPACTWRVAPPRQRMALACSGQRLRTALLTNAVAWVVVGCASDRTSRRTTRPNPRPSIPSPSHTTVPSRNSSPSEAAARSLLPKVIARASPTNGTGPAVAMDEDVVASAVLSSRSVLQPAAGAVRRLSKTTCCISHRTTARIVSPPRLARLLKRQRAKHRYRDLPAPQRPSATGRALPVSNARYQRLGR